MSSPAPAKAAGSDPLLLRQDAEGVATLTLNRPAQRNALSLALIEELHAALDSVREDPIVRVVVIAGAGPAFSAGHDLKELRADASGDHCAAIFRRCGELMLAITRLPKPVIARVHGIASAAGCQLVATCDLAVADETARFATPGVDIGLFCSTPMVALSRVVPRKPAMAMLLTGEMVSAAEARRIGLVNRVVPAHRLDAEVASLAQTIVAKSPAVLAIGKAAFYCQLELDLAEAYAYTSAVMAQNLAADDAAEGIDAFLEKRKPRWRGC